MDPKDALAIAKAATSDAVAATDAADPRGLKSGDKVTVSADDYGRDPIAGEIVFSNRHEIAIKRNDAGRRRCRRAFPACGLRRRKGVTGMSIVEIAQGKLEGFAKDGVLRFNGIPYAKPPVGPLRWRPAEAPEPWAGVRDASRFGNIAPQVQSAAEALIGGTPGEQSEDCLYLNVCTPSLERQAAGDGVDPWRRVRDRRRQPRHL